MGWLASLFGGGVASLATPIEAIGNIVDELYDSDEEMLEKKIIMQRLAQKPALAQVELNKLEAQHRSIFVAGWRPFIGWVCGLGLFNTFIINPWLEWATGRAGPQLPLDVMVELVVALLGLATIRMGEKLAGRAK